MRSFEIEVIMWCINCQKLHTSTILLLLFLPTSAKSHSPQSPSAGATAPASQLWSHSLLRQWALPHEKETSFSKCPKPNNFIMDPATPRRAPTMTPQQRFNHFSNNKCENGVIWSKELVERELKKQTKKPPQAPFIGEQRPRRKLESLKITGNYAWLSWQSGLANQVHLLPWWLIARNKLINHH